VQQLSLSLHVNDKLPCIPQWRRLSNRSWKARLEVKKSQYIYGKDQNENVMSEMLGAKEIYTQIPYLEGKGVFGSTNKKLDLPISSKDDFHCLDKVNITHQIVLMNVQIHIQFS
jgi:hypothetical protein